MSARSLCVLAIGLAASALAAPSPAAGTASAPSLEVTPGAEREVFKIKIGTMRRSSTAGKGLGVYAELENVTGNTITIFSGETVLVVPPDLVGKGVCVLTFASIVPTELMEFDKFTPDSRGIPVTLKASEKYRVFWDLTSPSTDPVCWDKPAASPPAGKPAAGANAPRSRVVQTGLWESFKDALYIRMAGFVPGPYNFTVEGKAYPDPANRSDYYTFVENADLNMEIPQTLVIVGAILGGWLGYLVSATSTNGDFSQRPDMQSMSQYLGYAWRIFYKLLSAALLSVVVTILLSRLSDTQFAIKVSVADFWGAITIGFLSYFLGNKLIDQIVQKLNGKPA